MLRRIVFATALAAAVASPAWAQQPPPESDTTIVVQAQREEEAVREFVAEIGAAPDGMNLARWGEEVCVGVYNMSHEYAQKLVDRVSLIAAAIGIEPGEPGCRPNVLIMASTDGPALAKRLVADHLQQFRPSDTHGADLGRVALKQFQTSDAPVRWWHVSQEVLADTGAAVRRGTSVRVRGASRLSKNVRQDISHVLIILDGRRIGSVSFGALSDYIAMVALAQVDADAETRGYPTVLNLFGSPSGERTARMTQWDLDYLISLYEVNGDAVSADRERRRIARQMLDRQAKADDDQ
jgi:hypothetical protein